MLVRADSAFYGHPTIDAAVRAGANVSVTVRLTSNNRAAIATITEQAWTPIRVHRRTQTSPAPAPADTARVPRLPCRPGGAARGAPESSPHVPGGPSMETPWCSASLVSVLWV